MASLLIRPIWYDTFYSSTADTLVYKIMLEGETIFSGKAVKYPDAERVEININKICRNYLESDIAEMLDVMPDVRESENNRLSQRTFNLYVNDVNVMDYMFYLDYSYDWTKGMSGEINVSAPINGHYVPGMMRLQTTRTTRAAAVSSVYTECCAGPILDDDDYLGYTTQVA